MDFLKIRKKARERGAGRKAAAPPPPAASPPPATSPGADAAAAAELDRELAARLAGDEEGFTTWRPGSGPPPLLAEPAPPPRALPVARTEDFAVVARASAPPAAAAEQVAAAPEPDPPPAVARTPLDEFFYRPDEETPGLPEVEAPAAPAPEGEAEPAAREEYLTFLLGREEYAIAIERVREVVKAPPVTEVPRAPAHIVGVASVRGDIVAVLDPRRRLGLPGAPPTGGAGRIVIVDTGDGACGLLVDAVASVVRLPPGAIEPCPQGIAGSRAEYLAGIGHEGDRMFTVLDLGALLRRAASAGARRPDEEGRRAGA